MRILLFNVLVDSFYVLFIPLCISFLLLFFYYYFYIHSAVYLLLLIFHSSMLYSKISIFLFLLHLSAFSMYLILLLHFSAFFLFVYYSLWFLRYNLLLSFIVTYYLFDLLLLTINLSWEYYFFIVDMLHLSSLFLCRHVAFSNLFP